MTSRLDSANQMWMTAPATLAVMGALTADGGDARFVGGAVRNALLGTPVADVDIATPLNPEDVIQRLLAAGLGAVPTGIEHGTVTAVSDGKPFEVTTLRRDVSTDGRRAVVAFTADWKEDASRRDFTMNALYADANGEVFDYFSGIEDLRAGRVRFVGHPTTRIREDYLRVLRLFRFHAWYGKGSLDDAALAAAISEKSGLKSLSGERVQKEMLRLLQAKDPMPALRTMQDGSILSEVLGIEPRLERLRALCTIEAVSGLAPDSLLRLAALLPDAAGHARRVADALRLSNAGRDRLIEIADTDRRVNGSLGDREARKLLYRLGAASFRDQLLLNWATSGMRDTDPRWGALVGRAGAWSKPPFPLDGKDVMAAGIDEGPKIGVVLKALEDEWLDSDFTLDRTELLKRLKERARR